MNRYLKTALLTAACLLFSSQTFAQNNSTHNPTWWAKYQYLSQSSASPCGSSNSSLPAGSNVDVSNECGPQSETYITINPASSKLLAAGSNEIFRDPMRGYFSSDGGSTWGAVDAPLPPPLQGTNDTRFGSDPSLVFDSRGNLFYSYIVVYFGAGNGVDGSQMAVARSIAGGMSYPQLTLLGFQRGSRPLHDQAIRSRRTHPRRPPPRPVFPPLAAS